MIFLFNFLTLRDFETQFTDSLIREKEKSLTSTKDNDKFKNENISHHNNNNLIDEKFFVDDDDNNHDINIKLKSMTKEKIKSFQRKENFEKKIYINVNS